MKQKKTQIIIERSFNNRFKTEYLRIKLIKTE